MVSKVKYSGTSDLTIQMPKMKLILNESIVLLEFLNNKGYSKKVCDFLSTLDSKLLEYIYKKSEEWFGKKIPIEKITEMYSGSSISSIDSEGSECTRIKVNINKKDTSLIDKKNNELENFMLIS
jgi:hypothetical protein